MIKGLLTQRRESVMTTVILFVILIAFTLFASNFDIGTFGVTLLSGLLKAMLLFLVGAGLALIFGLMDILNFAQGGTFMLGAYITYDLVHPNLGALSFLDGIPDPGLRFTVALIFGTAAGGILGYILERGLLRPLYKRPLFQLVLTFGVSIILLELVKLVWGPTPYAWTQRLALQDAQFVLFGQPFSVYRLFVIGMGLVMMVGVIALLRFTRIGIIVLGLAALLAGAGCKPKPKPITDLQRKEADHLVAEAGFAMNLRDWARAEGLLAKAVQFTPDTGVYWISLGSMRMRLGNKPGAKIAYEGALKAYADAAKVDTRKEVEPWLKQVQVLALLGRIDDARAMLEKTDKRFPCLLYTSDAADE